MKQNKVPKIEYSGKEPSSKRGNPYKSDVIYSNLGQWKYPGQVTRIPSGDITMQGVPYPVYGEDNLGHGQMMYPGMDYQFPGQSVTEYPQLQTGGMLATSSYNTPLQKQYTPAELKKFDEYNRLNSDSNLENILEIVDPTGISSWDDVYRSYKQSGMSPETYLEIVGALPLLGKVGKIAKGFSALAKTSRQARSLNNFTNAMQAASITGKASDAYQAYDQYQKQDGGWLDEYQSGGSKNPEWYNGKIASGMKYPIPPSDKRRIPQSGIVVDKRTNQAYYFGDKGETGTFPVLTGKNPEGNINTYSLEELKGNAKLRNTPTGYYTVNKESTYKTPEMLQHYAGRMRDVEPISAYGVPAPHSKDLGFHLTYMDPFNPAIYKNRDSLYRGKDVDRNASYGCVNCERESYDAFNRAIPKTDTMMVLDSKNYADRLLLEQAKNRIKTKPLLEEGGWLDEVEEFRRGGQKGLKHFTSKNIQSSVNDIMMRNETLFGPAGKRRYKPGLKYKHGGNWLDNLH